MKITSVFIVKMIFVQFLTWFLFVGYLEAQIQNTSSQKIPLDPKVHYGKLENGLTYYICKNTNPPGKVWMYLVVRAGSYQEEKDQAALAHLLEHMPFRRTTNFTDACSYFETKGLLRGNNLNAHTSDNCTYYTFQDVPSNNVELINDGLKFLYDCAGEIQLRPSDIDSERNVLLSEIRPDASFSQSSKIREIYWPKVTGEPQYHGVFNQMKNVAEFDHKSLIRFYEKWYRPDLQAVIVVGDIDPLKIEQQVKTLFSRLEKGKEQGDLSQHPFNVDAKNQFILITDEKQSEVEVKIYMRHLYKPLPTLEEIRFSLNYTLFNTMFRNRLNKIMENNNTPIKYIQGSYEPIMGQQSRDSLFGALITEIQFKQDSTKQGINSAIIELERLRRFGFTTKEFDSAKKQLTESMKKTYTSSGMIVNVYKDDFLLNNSYQKPIYQEKLVMQSLNRLTLKEVNSLANELITNVNTDIVVIGPEQGKETLPNETILREGLNKAKEKEIEPYKEKETVVLTKPIISKEELAKLKMVAIKEQTTFKEIGVTSFKLPNGVKVLLKPIHSASSTGKISLRGVSPGGASSFLNDNDYTLARNVASLVTQCGFGQLDGQELDLFMNENKISCGIFVSERTEGINASSEVSGLETMLQTVYQHFTSPRYDKECVKNWLNTQNTLIASLSKQSSMMQFYDTINSTVNKYFTRPEFSSGKSPKDIDIDRVREIYNSRFGNAGDFVFVIAGDFIPKNIMPAVARYLGNLPSKGFSEKYQYNNVYNGSRAPINKSVYMGNSEKAYINIHYTGSYVFNPVKTVELGVLRNVLYQIMTYRLRAKEGKVYSVSMNLKNQKEKSGIYDINISFECACSNKDAMIEAVEQEIEILKKEGPDSLSLQRALALEERNLIESLSNPDFWTDYLSKQNFLGDNLLEVTKWKKNIIDITSEKIRQVANEFLKGEHLISFILLPESMSPATTKYGATPADSIMMLAKVNYFAEKRMYAEYTDAFIAFTEKYNNNRTAAQVNTDAWKVFKFSTDMKQLEVALDWVSLALADNDKDVFYLDTYANILYKMGKPEKAISIEKQAFNYIEKIDREIRPKLTNTIALTLFTMEKREPTWFEYQGDPFKTLYPAGLSKKSDNYYWKKIAEIIHDRFIGIRSDSVICAAKMNYYKKKENWSQFTKNITDYVSKYNDMAVMHPTTLNNYAWQVFLYSTNRKELKQALIWTQKALDYTPDPIYYYRFLDTYSNLLYKLGNQKEAIEWELKVIDKCPENEKAEFEAVVKKMKNGEKTW